MIEPFLFRTKYILGGAAVLKYLRVSRLPLLIPLLLLICLLTVCSKDNPVQIKDPKCLIVPEAIDFGTLTVGEFKDTTFTVTNTGEGRVIGSFSETCSYFNIVSGGGGNFDLTADQSVTATVRFSPTVSGTLSCTISTGTECADISMTGICINPPECQLSLTSLDFGALTVGAYKDTTFTITNVGEETLHGNVSETCSHFDIFAGAGPFALTTGQFLTVTVRYQPTASGTQNCTIETGTECVNVSCTGVAESPPSCLVSKSTLDFGNITIGNTSDLDFTITNTGESLLSGSVEETCDHYRIVSGGGYYSLAFNQSVIVSVRFEPTVSGTHDCTIETGAECANVSCSGVGDDPPECDMSLSNIDFGTVVAGTYKDTTFTITNTGGGTLSGDVSEICDHYSIVSGGGGYALTNGQMKTVTIRYAPTLAGSHGCAIGTGMPNTSGKRPGMTLRNLRRKKMVPSFLKQKWPAPRRLNSGY